MRCLAFIALTCLSLPAVAQARADAAWAFDPQQLLARSESVIVRTPDATLDALFQAVVEAARQPAQLQAMCAVFEPDARRDLATLNRIALAFPAASQRRFQRATEQVLAASQRAPPQPYDDALARRALRQAAIAAAMLYDGFAAAINGVQQGSGEASGRAARCRALRQLLDTLSMRPLPERAMVTRLLMREGLQRVER